MIGPIFKIFKGEKEKNKLKEKVRELELLNRNEVIDHVSYGSKELVEILLLRIDLENLRDEKADQHRINDLQKRVISKIEKYKSVNMEKLRGEKATKLDVVSLNLDIQKTNLKVDKQLSQVQNRVQELSLLRRQLLGEQLKFMDGMIQEKKEVDHVLSKIDKLYNDTLRSHESLAKIERNQELLMMNLNKILNKGLFTRFWELLSNTMREIRDTFR